MFTSITNAVVCAACAIYFAYEGNPIMFALSAAGLLTSVLSVVMEHTAGPQR